MDEVIRKGATSAILEFENSVRRQLDSDRASRTKLALDGKHKLAWTTSLPLHEVATTLLNEATRFNLVAIPQDSLGGLRILVFDPLFPSGNARTWSLLVVSGIPSVPAQQRFNSQTNTPSSLLSWLPHITRYENPAFFTILGPEGVGKTTLCNNLIKIFQKFPIRFRQFHHTAEWKGGYHADEAMTLTSKLKQQKEASLEVNRAPAKMPSFLRKCLPKNALHNLSAFRAELIYMDRVSKYLKAGHKAKDLVISDRYCYDRLVRWQNLNKAPGQRLGARLVCRLMRRPIAAFVLRDSAENIHSRKQVMSMQEIELHQEMLVRTCTKLRVPFEELWVTKKTAECVASLVTKRILELAGHRMFEVVNFDPQ